MAIKWKKLFSLKSMGKKDNLMRMGVTNLFTGGGPVASMLSGPLYNYRGSTTSIGQSVQSEKDDKQGARVQMQIAASRADAASKEETAQKQAQRAQESQLAARRRNKRFAYGYNRSSDASGLGGGGPAGGNKTLLGY